MQTENGAQRAQRRAAACGLTVGAPVRARIGVGVGAVRMEPNPHWVPYGERAYAGPGGAAPLGRVDRLARYLLQRDVTTHVRHGSSWRPTARQRRRLDKKSHRAVPPYAVTPESERLAEFWTQRPDTSVMVAAETLAAMDTRGPAASAVIVDEQPREIVTNLATGEQHTEPLAAPVSPQEFVKPERERSAVNRNGYRVVDRRGEHR